MNMTVVKKHFNRIPPVLLVIIGLVIYFSFGSRHYFSMHNIINIMQQGSVLLVIAAAATFVIISGGLDLSLGGVLTFAGVCTLIAMNAGVPVPIAIIIGILSGAVSGAITGFLIAIVDMPPFIATLGMQGILFGFSLALTNSVGVLTDNQAFIFLGSKIGRYIPVAAILCTLIYLAAIFIQDNTRFGRYMFAIGGNEAGTRLSGINTTFWKFMVYVVAGIMSAMGGIILAARLQVADPIVGVQWEFDAIAAAILGGTTFDIGKGDVRGTLIGVLLITVLRNGLNVTRVPSIWQPAIIGTVIILAIVFQILVSNKRQA